MSWDTGRYLVKTQDAELVWDMDEGTITRKRGEEFIGDSEELMIKEVYAWPMVGQSYCVVVQVPSSGDFQWRQSSIVEDIEEL